MPARIAFSIQSALLVLVGQSRLRMMEMDSHCYIGKTFKGLMREAVMATCKWVTTVERSNMDILGTICVYSRYTHAHQVPYAEHMESSNGEARSTGETTLCCPPPIHSRISERSKSFGWWHASHFPSPLSCRLSCFCWVVNRLPYIWTRSGVVLYLPNPRPRSSCYRVMASWAAHAKRYVNYA